jgi:hypothetical protein
VDSRYSLRVAIHARVSTKDKGQDPENQLDQLRAFAEQHGSIYQVYTDQEPGGKTDRSVRVGGNAELIIVSTRSCLKCLFHSGSDHLASVSVGAKQTRKTLKRPLRCWPPDAPLAERK